jgi:hypothetical protein
VVVGLVVVVGTLLGPEGTTCGLLFRCQARSGGYTGHCVGGCCHLLVVLVSSVGLWVGRWLRIAQWTRASCFLWLSF